MTILLVPWDVSSRFVSWSAVGGNRHDFLFNNYIPPSSCTALAWAKTSILTERKAAGPPLSVCLSVLCAYSLRGPDRTVLVATGPRGHAPPPALGHKRQTFRFGRAASMEAAVAGAPGWLATEGTTREVWSQAPARLPSASPLVVLKQSLPWFKGASHRQGSPGRMVLLYLSVVVQGPTFH